MNDTWKICVRYGTKASQNKISSKQAMHHDTLISFALFVSLMNASKGYICGVSTETREAIMAIVASSNEIPILASRPRRQSNHNCFDGRDCILRLRARKLFWQANPKVAPMAAPM